MMTYLEAQETLSTARNEADGKPLGNNTRLFTRCSGFDQHYAVQLHKTDVVCIYKDHYQLYSGGWLSRTTKDRINLYSPAKINQCKGEWRLFQADGTFVPFYEGIEVDANGQVIK